MNETRVLPDSFAEAVADRTPVSLGTRRTNSPHEFYRYPARFSPRFAAAAIEEFTSPGDVVLDPFVGGGTTLVEGMRLGRRTVGGDLNPLATFVSRVKTTTLSP
jgi:DNA modification methylase